MTVRLKMSREERDEYKAWCSARGIKTADGVQYCIDRILSAPDAVPIVGGTVAVDVEVSGDYKQAAAYARMLGSRYGVCAWRAYQAQDVEL